MIRAILVDDEPLARMIIREYLQTENTVEVVGECQDGFEALKMIQQEKPDLLFLDIQMPKINGFEMLELLDEPPHVIFTTAFDEYAMKAFEASAIDYLLKPFSKERFDKALAKVISQNKITEEREPDEASKIYMQQAQRIVIKNSGKIVIIPLQDIAYFEAADDYVKIHTREQVYLKNRTLSYYEKALADTGFIRAHRSILVNSDYITRIDPYGKETYSALLTTGERVTVSKSGFSRIEDKLG